jgi:hypothetical protein
MTELPPIPVGVSTSEFDFEKYRAQLRQMADDDLIMHGEMLSRLSSPDQNFADPLNEQWVRQLNECREEWKRRRQSRHPKQINM